VVHARVGSRGQIVLSDHTKLVVDPDVLRIVARELAFPRVLAAGTPIEAVYEVDVARGARLTALRIGTGIGARQAFYYRSVAGQAEGFFGRDGRGLEHRLLRYPLAFSYISSGFSAARMHPILHTYHPHNGVDFAARPGTPVLAAGAGTIVEAAWDGRFGRTVRIRHDGGLVSGYAHLQGFAAGVRAGVTVRKGQIIGYVGASGLATGPHLHYSVTKNGRYVDPLGPDLPKRPSLTVAAMLDFQRVVARVDHAVQIADASEAAPTLLARSTTR
jgi:murein DD-endopeptidase MepM/ murein hydrolase activator NlpD